MVVERVVPSSDTKLGLCTDQKVQTDKHRTVTPQMAKIFWFQVQRKICHALS